MDLDRSHQNRRLWNDLVEILPYRHGSALFTLAVIEKICLEILPSEGVPSCVNFTGGRPSVHGGYSTRYISARCSSYRQSIPAASQPQILPPSPSPSPPYRKRLFSFLPQERVQATPRRPAFHPRRLLNTLTFVVAVVHSPSRRPIGPRFYRFRFPPTAVPAPASAKSFLVSTGGDHSMP